MKTKSMNSKKGIRFKEYKKGFSPFSIYFPSEQAEAYALPELTNNLI